VKPVKTMPPPAVKHGCGGATKVAIHHAGGSLKTF
jgi:hypothetical protein